jgi:heme A synthase
MKLNRFAKFAWIVLAYNLAVILLGAYVRASKSGDGCGSHWPLCNGEVIPLSPTVKTMVEFSHRLTSGLAGILAVVLLVWAFRVFARRHQARYGALSVLIFTVIEALIGAGLVLLELVAENKSMWRAVWMSGHLINTFLLVGALTFTAWVATTGGRISLRGQSNINWILLAAIIATLILGVSGAVSALGATLFPVKSIAEGLQQDFSPVAHQLTRLRVIHPSISIIVSALLIYTGRILTGWRPGGGTKRVSNIMALLIGVQLVAGVANLFLHAPVWLQIVHLFLADLIWIALMLLAFTVLAQAARQPSFGIAEPAPAR